MLRICHFVGIPKITKKYNLKFLTKLSCTKSFENIHLRVFLGSLKLLAVGIKKMNKYFENTENL